jgi:hypothetical protein
VKLHRAPQEHAVLVHEPGLLLQGEQHVERGALAGELECRGDQALRSAAPAARTLRPRTGVKGTAETSLG